MKRRRFVVAIAAGALATPFDAFAQQQGKVWRVGFLSTRPDIGPSEEGFRRGMRESGYIEGQNVVIEWRFSHGVSDQLPELAAELVRLNIDCIVTNGTNASVAANQATRTIPIVMGNSEADPARVGLVASLARPGGNVTGFTSISAALAGKRLEILKETLPKISRVGILWDPDSRAGAALVRQTRLATRTLGLQLQTLEVWKTGEIESAFHTAAKDRVQALLVVTAGLINSLQPQILNLALKARLPVMYANTLWPRVGGLMGYGTDLPDQYRRAAAYVDKILKGAKPADLPVQQPTKFEFIVNLKAAKQIGLTIPPSVLARADKVIE